MSDGMESDVPSYRTTYILQLILLAIFTLGLQVGLVFLIPKVAWKTGGKIVPATSGPMGNTSATTVLPGNSAVWHGELWVSVVSGVPNMPSSTAVRRPSARLLAIDVDTGKSRETSIVLIPAPLGLLVLDDELWAVSENVVQKILGQQVVSRYPRRGLIQPTKPFIYDGRLAVIDQNKNDVYTLLTWHDGEWDEIGQIEAPSSSSLSRWALPELRVMADGNTVHLFFSDGQTISYREGLVFVSAAEPVSALRPENQLFLTMASNSIQPTKTRILPGWNLTSITASWGAWDVTIADGELHAFSYSPYNSADIQQYTYRNGTWSSSTLPLRTSRLSAASGTPGYLVADDLRIYSIDRSTQLQHVTAEVRLSEKIGHAMLVCDVIARYLVAMSVLGIGAWWLMRTHRQPQYVYGKKHVLLASIVRRGVARGIDTMITVFPALFWFTAVVDTESQLSNRFVSPNGFDLLSFILLSIFGMWLGSILALSFLEGRWGQTPGKWLMGIRTLRTTLRPCGMLRALARELLVYADSLFLVTWLPGVAMIATTLKWQRLGDLAADTVVVAVQKEIE